MILISPPRGQLLLVVHRISTSLSLVLGLGRSFHTCRIVRVLAGLEGEWRELQSGLARAGLLRSYVSRVTVLSSTGVGQLGSLLCLRGGRATFVDVGVLDISRLESSRVGVLAALVQPLLHSGECSWRHELGHFVRAAIVDCFLKILAGAGGVGATRQVGS